MRRHDHQPIKEIHAVIRKLRKRELPASAITHFDRLLLLVNDPIHFSQPFMRDFLSLTWLQMLQLIKTIKITSWTCSTESRISLKILLNCPHLAKHFAYALITHTAQRETRNPKGPILPWLVFMNFLSKTHYDTCFVTRPKAIMVPSPQCSHWLIP